MPSSQPISAASRPVVLSAKSSPCAGAGCLGSVCRLFACSADERKQLRVARFATVCRQGVDLKKKGNDERRLNELMLAIGRCTAWSHLRGSGRQGSAIADKLVAFGSDDSWLKVLRKASTTCADNINVE